MRSARPWIAVVLLVGLVAGFLYWRSDRRRIHRQLDRLEQLMSKDGAEQQLVSFGIVRQVTECFSSGFLIRAQPWDGTLSDERQLAGALTRYRSAANRIEAAVRDRKLEIDGSLGLATLVGVAEVVMDFRGEEGRELREVRIEWVEEEGRWKISEIELLEPVGEAFRW